MGALSVFGGKMRSVTLTQYLFGVVHVGILNSVMKLSAFMLTF